MLPDGCAPRCPACPQRELSAEESAARKDAWLRSELGEWSAVLAPIVFPSRRWGYRRKVTLHARLLAGAWQFGMVRMQGREEEFVPIPDCPLHDPAVNEVLAWVRPRLRLDLPLSFVIVSGGAVTLVLKCERREDWLAHFRAWERVGGWPGGSLWVNWNPGAGKRAVDSRRNELVFGETWLEENGFRHGPSAFRQQIPEVEEQALVWAEEFLAGAGVDAGVPAVADFYCGLGTSLRRWRARGWDALGVELSGESLAAAVQNAPGVQLLRGRVEERLPQVGEWLGGRDFVVYTNPPRSGHGERVLRWLLEKRPARIAYLSCHPRSLGGDLRALGVGFSVKALRPLDFFPQTGQVETLALLERA